MHGRYCLFILSLRVFCHTVPVPPEIEQLSDSRIDGAIANQDKSIPQLHLKMVLIDAPVVDHAELFRYLHNFAVPDKNTARIVKLHQIGGPVIIDLKDAEGRVRHLPDAADREGFRNRLNAFLQRNAP